MASESREKFVSIAETRVNKILDALDSLSKLSNGRRYDYTDDDIKKIFNAISDKVKNVKAAFESEGKSDNRFTLS